MASRRVTEAHTAQVPNEWWQPALLITRRKKAAGGAGRADDSMSALICRWVIGYVRRNARDWLTEDERAQLPKAS